MSISIRGCRAHEHRGFGSSPDRRRRRNRPVRPRRIVAAAGARPRRGAGGFRADGHRAGGAVCAMDRALRSLLHRPHHLDAGAERPALVRDRQYRPRYFESHPLRHPQHAGAGPGRGDRRWRHRRRARHLGGARLRLPVHGAAYRDHPKLRHLRHRACRQFAWRRLPRRSRSEVTDMIRFILTAALALTVSAPASAQTLTLMKGIDAPHYDGQRTTWGPTSDIVNMFQDTLVALDWDGRTPIPYLAKSWDISEDGKIYTFKLRDDVSFCSGKKFTSADVVYSFKRLKDPAIKGPYAWRAGHIKELRAPDPYTVQYELEEPFSELLLQLTMFTNVIHNKESVEALGKDYGIKGADGTGPWCFESWQPRPGIVLKRHGAYKWVPSIYKNKGPVKFEKLSVKIVHEESSREAVMMDC